MMPFTSTVECSKCGSVNVEKKFAQWFEFGKTNEWIYCKCLTCKNFWNMKCKDAPVEE